MDSKSSENYSLKVRVQPRASRNEVDGFEEGILRLRVTASPTSGQANSGVISLLSDTLSVSKSRLTIVRGHSSKNKLVSVATLMEQEVRHRIKTWLEGT